MFVVRHKHTQRFLPTMKGASWWEGEEEGPPRLFVSKRAAQNFVIMWAKGRAAVERSYSGEWGLDEVIGLKFEDRNRKRTDLEIIPVTLTFGEPL